MEVIPVNIFVDLGFSGKLLGLVLFLHYVKKMRIWGWRSGDLVHYRGMGPQERPNLSQSLTIPPHVQKKSEKGCRISAWIASVIKCLDCLVNHVLSSDPVTRSFN